MKKLHTIKGRTRADDIRICRTCGGRFNVRSVEERLAVLTVCSQECMISLQAERREQLRPCRVCSKPCSRENRSVLQSAGVCSTKCLSDLRQLGEHPEVHLLAAPKDWSRLEKQARVDAARFVAEGWDPEDALMRARAAYGLCVVTRPPRQVVSREFLLALRDEEATRRRG